MAIEIKKENGAFKIFGAITSQNMQSLKNYFESVIHQDEQIVLNVERLNHIDKSGAFMLEGLYKSAAFANKVISIVGRQNKKIFHKMTETNTSYIFCNDRV
ncbi:STAS domain-containing protein [Spongiimicrobium salis]|uniref:STAS domain-containing protein n=1 Tax=Spongiimicrobium salis TaxID=1667022 RepID=UPI00374D7FA1